MYSTVGQRLSDFIKEILKIKDNEFAVQIGLTKQTLSNILTDKNQMSMDKLKTIAQTYPAINLRWLVLGEGEMLLGEAVSPASAITLHGNGANNQNSIHSTASPSEREMALLRELLSAHEKIIKAQEALIATLTPKGDTP